MIVLVRHPIAVARSVRELGWIDHDDLEHAFEHEVTRWCHAHAHAFADERLSDVHFVDYATLRENPTEQLASIVAYASARDRTWRSLKVGRIDVERSSSTNFRGTTTSKESAHTWHGVSDSLIEFALTTLDAHGLSAIYGVNARALCDLNEFAQACRLRRG